MKVLVVVPVYNCEPIVHSVIEDILKQTQLNVLVIDDGSIPSLEIRKDDRLSLVSHKENRGKGFAIRTALTWAQENSYTHILCIDGDGQHRAEDISLLLKKCDETPEGIIIGSRIFDETVPGVSRFGRLFSNFWVQYQTGKKLTDTQSGLRIYPIQHFQNLSFFTGRYDFEIEILVRGLWGGVPVDEVSVGVIYPSKEERISHFDKFWDNLRLTGLNVLLVAYSLVFYHRSLFRVFLAGGIAFLAALFPSLVWGVVFGLFACLVFRVNATLTMLGFVVLNIF